MIDWTIIGSVSIAVLGICGTLLTAKIQHKGRPENALIDQLQEEMSTLRTDENALKRRERLRDDYIVALRDHINAGNPPPPPPWPSGLYE